MFESSGYSWWLKPGARVGVETLRGIRGAWMGVSQGSWKADQEGAIKKEVNQKKLDHGAKEERVCRKRIMTGDQCPQKTIGIRKMRFVFSR